MRSEIISLFKEDFINSFSFEGIEPKDKERLERSLKRIPVIISQLMDNGDNGLRNDLKVHVSILASTMALKDQIVKNAILKSMNIALNSIVKVAILSL